MLSMIKNLFARKVGLRLNVRAAITPQTALALQSLLQATGLPGHMNVRAGLAQIELEGPQHKLQALILRLQQQSPLFPGPVVLETGWRDFTGQFSRFTVTM